MSKRSFKLSAVDAGPSVTPVQNSVIIRSTNATAIHDGTATAKPDDTAQVALAAMELRFRAGEARANVTGSLPLTLVIARANVTSAEGGILLQVPEGQGAGGVVLDLMLKITGIEPSFQIARCRASTGE